MHVGAPYLENSVYSRTQSTRLNPTLIVHGANYL